METKINEIAGGIYRLSTFVPDIAPPAGFTFNQFLVLGDDPLLFHTGPRRMFPLIRTALSRVLPPERLRWITFGHYEADECGAMDDWLAVAPHAKVAHGQTGCFVSLNDMADRMPQVLQDGRSHRSGQRQAGPLPGHAAYSSRLGRRHSVRRDKQDAAVRRLVYATRRWSCVDRERCCGPAIAAEDIFQYSSLNPGMGMTIRRLAELSPRTLALMHGPSFSGDGATALRALAENYDSRILSHASVDAAA